MSSVTRVARHLQKLQLKKSHMVGHVGANWWLFLLDMKSTVQQQIIKTQYSSPICRIVCGLTHREDAVKRRALRLQVSVHDPSARRRVTHLGSPGGRGKGRSAGESQQGATTFHLFTRAQSPNLLCFHADSEAGALCRRDLPACAQRHPTLRPKPKLQPFCPCRPLQTELGTSPTWPD